MRIKCLRLEILNAETEPLRASADFELTDFGIRLRDCIVTDESVFQWLDLPAAGRKVAAAVLAEFTDMGKHAAFTKAAIKSAKEACGDAGHAKRSDHSA